jgi:hypothetical protein
VTEIANAYGIISRSSRIRLRRDSGEQFTAQEAAMLLGVGVLAAAMVTWMPLPLRIPGHAILKAAVPIVLGVAAVPRPLAGSIAGLAAAAMLSLSLAMGAAHVPAAAATALLAIGPAIDLAVLGIHRARWSVYLRFAAAGLAANLLAFLVRWGTSSFGLDGSQPHQMVQMGGMAFLSFAMCGICAGFLSAVVCFRNRSSQPGDR